MDEIETKVARTLEMGEWFAYYGAAGTAAGGPFLGWRMVIRPWQEGRISAVSRAADAVPVLFSLGELVVVEVWVGKGYPPATSPADYRAQFALRETKTENARLKEENAQLLAEVARLTAPPPQEAGKTHPQRAYDRLPSPVRSVVDAYARELFEEIPNQTFHALVVSVWNLARQHYAEQDAVQQRMLSELEQKYTQLQASSSATNDDLRAQVVRVTRERDRVSADLVRALHTPEEIEGFVGKLEEGVAAKRTEAPASKLLTLPQWLFRRYALSALSGGTAWEHLLPESRARWDQDALAVLAVLEGEGLRVRDKRAPAWGIAKHLSLPLDLLPKDPAFGVCKVLSCRGRYYVEVLPDGVDMPEPPDWLKPIFAYAREHNSHGVLFHSGSKTKYDPLTSPKMR